jgi:parvulin-like peptidyl-prolyl isomerase
MNINLPRVCGIPTLAALMLCTAVAQDDKPATPAVDDNLPDPVAIVEGDKISRADLQDTFNMALAASGISPDDLTPEQRMTGYREILDELIIDRLVSRKASAVDVSDADVEEEIGRVKEQFPNEEVFQAEMARAGETESSFRTMVKTMLQQQRWMDSQIGDQASVPDEDVQKFYEENKAEFEHPELVRASHILIRLPEDPSDDVVAEKKKEAEAALERVTTNKEDFAAVAAEVSEEPGAAERGGDLDFFPKDRMVPEFAEAAFAMKTGDISKEPVRTKFGWHVIQVTDRKPAGSMPLDEVKEQVTAFLEGGKRREAVRGIIEGVRSEAKVEIKLPEAPGS